VLVGITNAQHEGGGLLRGGSGVYIRAIRKQKSSMQSGPKVHALQVEEGGSSLTSKAESASQSAFECFGPARL